MITDADIERLLKTAEIEEAVRLLTFRMGEFVEILDDEGVLVKIGRVGYINWYRGVVHIRFTAGSYMRVSIFDANIKPLRKEEV